MMLSLVAGCALGCAKPAPAEAPVAIEAGPPVAATPESDGDVQPKQPQAETNQAAPKAKPQPDKVTAAKPVPHTIKELELAFELPGEHYRPHADKRDPSKGLVHLGFERDDVHDKSGHPVRPYCGITSESVPPGQDIVMYSLSWRLRVPFSVDEVFTHNDGSLQLKNAIGYRGTTSYNGDEHTVVVVHALHKSHGFVIVCDATTSVYDQVKTEFADILHSFRPTVASP